MQVTDKLIPAQYIRHILSKEGVVFNWNKAQSYSDDRNVDTSKYLKIYKKNVQLTIGNFRLDVPKGSKNHIPTVKLITFFHRPTALPNFPVFVSPMPSTIPATEYTPDKMFTDLLIKPLYFRGKIFKL